MLTLFGRLAGHEVTRFHLRDQLEDIDPATDTTLMLPVLRKKKKLISPQRPHLTSRQHHTKETWQAMRSAGIRDTGICFFHSLRLLKGSVGVL